MWHSHALRHVLHACCALGSMILDPFRPATLHLQTALHAVVCPAHIRSPCQVSGKSPASQDAVPCLCPCPDLVAKVDCCRQQSNQQPNSGDANSGDAYLDRTLAALLAAQHCSGCQALCKTSFTQEHVEARDVDLDANPPICALT